MAGIIYSHQGDDDILNPQHLGILLTIISAAGFGTLAIFIKIAYGAGANTLTVMTFRFLLGSICLWSVIGLKQLNPRIERTQLIKLCLLGICGYSIMSGLFAFSLHFLSASLSTILLYTYPALVTLLSFAIGDEKFTAQKGFALLICFIGLVLVVGISTANISIAGVLLALGAASVYSGYIVISNKLLKSIHSLLVSTYICSAAAAAYLLVGTLTKSLILDISFSGWLAIGGMAVLGTLVAVLFFFAGMALIGPSSASIISNIEPVVTVVLSAILLSETITPLQTSGGLLILFGILILQSRKKEPSAPSSV